MFYDERIENTKGKIARNAIFLSLIISSVLGSIRLANVLRNMESTRYLCLVGLEVIIVLICLICLLIGFIRNKLQFKDERALSQQNAYYNKASSILIKLILLEFAVLFPIVLYVGHPYNFSDVGFDSILVVLFFVIGIYVIYSFRRNDIYFNYSIMENEHYWKSVFKNIGKLALYALFLVAVSAGSLILFVLTKHPEQTVLLKILLQIGSVYIGGLIELSLLYLLYSFLEKASYRSTRILSGSTVLSLVITVFIYAIYTAIVIFVDSLPISQASAIQLVTVASSLGTYIKFALLIFFTYFEYEYQKQKPCKLLSAACLTVIFSETLSVLLQQISGCLINVWISEIIEHDTYFIQQIFSTINTLIKDGSDIANAVGFSLMTVALIKDQALKKANLIVIPLLAVLGGIEIFLRTQAGILQVNLFHSLAEIGILCYFAILTAYVGKKSAAEG